MTAEDFKAWREHMGLSQVKAAEALGISKSSVENYERGARPEDGRPVLIPRPVALACSALSRGLDEWRANELAASAGVLGLGAVEEHLRRIATETRASLETIREAVAQAQITSAIERRVRDLGGN